MKKYQVFFLFFIFAVAILLRFWNLTSIPPSLSHDEMAIGYNAWSILQTGKDEYGTPFPILFRSFDDYKLPGYIYLTVISEAFFGLNEFAVRFTSAFLGVLTVVAFYFLVKELYPSFLVPVIAAAMMAINPWHINFSRAAFETNASLFFIVAGVLFLLKGLKRPIYVLIAATMFAISIYFYYTARILIPLILIIYFLLYRKYLLIHKKWLVVALIVGTVMLFPTVSYMFGAGLSRVAQVSILGDVSLTNPYSEAILRHKGSFFSRILYNRRLAFLQQFSDNYLKNLSPDFFFVSGTGSMGLLYLWEIPFFFWGLYLVFRSKEKWKWLFVTWFFAVPLVGGLSTGQPNSLRTLANAPMLVMFSTVGLYDTYQKIKTLKYFKIYLVLFFIMVSFFFIRFLALYFDYYPPITAQKWGDGYKQMVTYLGGVENKYDTVYISGYYWRPYIFVLFWKSYNPFIYQKWGKKESFSKYYFGRASWDNQGVFFGDTTLDFYSLIKADKKNLFILAKPEFEVHKDKFVPIDTIDGKWTKEVFVAAILKNK